MRRARTQEWNGSVSGEAHFISETTVPAALEGVEVPQRLDRQHEVAMQVVVREPVTAKVVAGGVGFRGDEDEAIVLEAVVWVPDVVASKARQMVPATPSLPNRSRKPKPSLAKTRLRKDHIAMRPLESERPRL